MVFFEDFLHFLNIKNFFCWIHQNDLVALTNDHRINTHVSYLNSMIFVSLFWEEYM